MRTATKTKSPVHVLSHKIQKAQNQIAKHNIISYLQIKHTHTKPWLSKPSSHANFPFASSTHVTSPQKRDWTLRSTNTRPRSKNKQSDKRLAAFSTADPKNKDTPCKEWARTFNPSRLRSVLCHRWEEIPITATTAVWDFPRSGQPAISRRVNHLWSEEIACGLLVADEYLSWCSLDPGVRVWDDPSATITMYQYS
jgi:hypothetical protein